jgi:hypothetical protein
VTRSGPGRSGPSKHLPAPWVYRPPREQIDPCRELQGDREMTVHPRAVVDVSKNKSTVPPTIRRKSEMTELLETEVQKTEDGFLAFLLELGQDEDTAVNIPASQDVLAVADILRQCVADGHLSSTSRWSVLDVAGHIGWCSGDGRMPADWVRDGLQKAHAELPSGVGFG